MMKLSADDLRYLGECAVLAATQAGKLIEEYASKTVKVEHKQAGDSIASQVVTEVDIKSEAIIVEALQPTCKKYALALLTEETEDDQSRLEKDYFWCVDPMDGTLAFTESVPGYSVSIALVAQTGEPIIGVVYDPVTHTLYSAVKGQGVLRNGQEWVLADRSKSSRPLLQICDRGMLQQGYYPELKQLLTTLAIENGYSGLEIQESNGAVLNACAVLENAPAVYFKCPKPEQGGGSIWDFAATAAIFNEAGATATDAAGLVLELNRAGSTYMHHRGVLFTTEQTLQSDFQYLIKEVC